MNDVINVNQQQLSTYYPDLKVQFDNGATLQLSGFITVNRSVNDFVLYKKYPLVVSVSKVTMAPPIASVPVGTINSLYPHVYNDGRLCLATDIDQLLYLEQDPSIVGWMKKFVEPYFVSYEYYQRYGEYPFGDRLHGYFGILQSYSDILKADTNIIYPLMDYIYRNEYRGHVQCPCGSGKKIRNCHGPDMLPIYKSSTLLRQVREDYNQIIKEVKKYVAEQHQNPN